MSLLIAKCGVILLLAGGSAALVEAQTASQDMKDAGHAAKNAGQDTGEAAENAGKGVGHATEASAKKVKHGTKRTVNAGARETEKGAAKVGSKTQP
jgi:hypothetical protein